MRAMRVVRWAQSTRAWALVLAFGRYWKQRLADLEQVLNQMEKKE